MMGVQGVNFTVDGVNNFLLSQKKNLEYFSHEII